MKAKPAISEKERKHLDVIVKRVAEALGWDTLLIRVLLVSCHIGPFKLDLERMATAPIFDVMHDVALIADKISQDGKSLIDDSRPRFAQKRTRRVTKERS